MANRVGVSLQNNVFYLLQADVSDVINIKDLRSYELKVPNFFANLSLDEEKALSTTAENIRKDLAIAKIVENEANIILPDEHCSMQIIKLPLVSEKEIISAIELQSEEFVPYPISKASFDYQILTTDKQNNLMYLLLIVTLKELVDKVSDYILSLGLYPTGIESESTTLFRLIMSKYVTINENIAMLVNINQQSTQISILNLAQQQLITTNSINIGSQFFYKALQNNLNIPQISAIEMFGTLKPDQAYYQKIILPVFNEFAKEVLKILMAAMEKLGTLPKNIYLYSHQNTTTFNLLFKSHSMLQQYNLINLNQVALNPNKVKFSITDKNKLSHYFVPFGAVAT